MPEVSGSSTQSTAIGTPVGSDIEYFDEITVLKATEDAEICDPCDQSEAWTRSAWIAPGNTLP